MNKNKLREWAKRYGLATVIALIGSVIFSSIARGVGVGLIIAAIVGTIATNVLFYGTILYFDYKKEKEESKRKNAKTKKKHIYFKLARNLLIEFGPAEILDTFFIRPLFLSIFPLLIGSYPLAILIGGIASDIVYFIPAIIAYETRKKIFKN